ncbi:TetR/AcrR family transcriptional regulator [Kordiimonas sp. SCSIO 12610]|uniref:TetR/AcrR family transcriptional regulator n=1 Tax=Kordiimonas sp. SCSIO 12610 TaxID=2829597 RepID=UPI00210CBAD9|nr:TetR/AcrR family transcriptional regulator [Kordiimonas sp. SCSIO 12610]UTW56299.1 TetR/AcrR family transcriptional regulator [Kordiimonas sp. SCSIO 12610]
MNIQGLAGSTRSINKAKRRDIILLEARKLIAIEGFEALKLRDLAARAGVTVPTIYNLIGGKPEILTLIIEDLVEQLQMVQDSVSQLDTEWVFENQINQLADLFAADEDYYRAAFIAGDRSGLFEQNSDTGIFARSVEAPIAACLAAQKSGRLIGRVSAEQMGRQIYGCYRLARQDWTNGYFDLKTFRRQALTGIFLCLAADAEEAFRYSLLKRISLLV